MELRLCADCRHYQASDMTEDTRNYDKCTRAGAAWATVDVVRGNHRPAFAEQERSYTSKPGACGPDARFWEPTLAYFTSSEEEASHV